MNIIFDLDGTLVDSATDLDFDWVPSQEQLVQI